LRSSAIITGGSSGLQQAFIKLKANLHSDWRICNLPPRSAAIFSAGKSLHHILRDPSRSGRIEHAAGQVDNSVAEVPGERFLLINSKSFGANRPLPEIIIWDLPQICQSTGHSSQAYLSQRRFGFGNCGGDHGCFFGWFSPHQGMVVMIALGRAVQLLLAI
jgi:hypothetical protein